MSAAAVTLTWKRCAIAYAFVVGFLAGFDGCSCGENGAPCPEDEIVDDGSGRGPTDCPTAADDAGRP
jgi:hypothetical protein